MDKDKEMTLDDLEELVTKSLKDLVKKGDISPAELERAEKAVCLMEKIYMLKEGGYSEDGMRSYGRYSMRGSYGSQDPHYSYMRGRDEDTGRYMSRGSSRYYDNGYSGHSIEDRAVAALEGMMDEAQTNYDRETLQNFIRMIRSRM